MSELVFDLSGAGDLKDGGGSKYPEAYRAYKAVIKAIYQEKLTYKDGATVKNKDGSDAVALKVKIESNEVEIDDYKGLSFNPKGQNFAKNMKRTACSAVAGGLIKKGNATEENAFGKANELVGDGSKFDFNSIIGGEIGVVFLPQSKNPNFANAAFAIPPYGVDSYNEDERNKADYDEWRKQKSAYSGGNGSTGGGEDGWQSSNPIPQDDDLPF